jgi:3-methyladenine DNA glycosylase AlkD
MKTPPYLQPIEASFHQNANPDKAIPMKKYMKNRFDFFGIPSPLRKEIFREHKLKYGLIPAGKEEEIVQWCWQQTEREYQYFAMEFLNKTAKKANEKIIDLYVYTLTRKSWWDTVDFIAANLVGTYLKRFPEKTEALTSEWMASGNMWLQRTCLLFQLKYKSETNTELLQQFISRLSESNEFFIRKVIGWILREYSKTDADFVFSYVAKYPLSALSQREALKWLKK